MYRYDNFDRQFVAERVSHYRAQTERFLAGELPEDEFLQLRLRNGLYIQRLAPMLRIAVPYGTLASEQLRMLAHIARHYDRGFGHLSTRQNMQFNWPELAEVPDILADLASVEMHAIQTSGNCIRNVTADQFAGVAHDETIDPRPYCEIIRQWSTAHPEFDWLPRKFKIAVTGASDDRAAVEVHDIGLRVYRDDDDSILFDVLVGGGLGRTPVIGQTIRRRLPVRHLLTYLEAIMRVYNRFGRRDNKYKARIKILVRAMTADSFRTKVDEEWSHLENSESTLTEEEITRMESHFKPPTYPTYDGVDNLQETRLGNPTFSRWVENNVAAHKVSGYAIVTLSTKITGVPPGDVSDLQMDAVADWADAYGFGEIRISHEQNFVLPDVAISDLFEVWQKADAKQLGATNVGLLSDIVCCPGGDYCSLANAKSIPVAEAIQQQFEDYDYQHDLGSIDLNISGCMNACGHHHVGHIGILGVDKKGSEFYQISLGGHSGHHGEASSLGQIIGPSFSRAAVTDVIRTILDVFVELRQQDESFLACFRRTGIEPFKERVYVKAA